MRVNIVSNGPGLNQWLEHFLELGVVHSCLEIKIVSKEPVSQVPALPLSSIRFRFSSSKLLNSGESSYEISATCVLPK